MSGHVLQQPLFCFKIATSCVGVEDLDPHLTHGSLGPPESTTQTASRSVQPFLQGSRLWQTDRQTSQSTL